MSLKDTTIGDIGKGLARYQPFIAAVVAVLLIVVFLPGHNKSQNITAAGAQPVAPAAGAGAAQANPASGGAVTTTRAAAAGAAGASAADASTSAAGSAGGAAPAPAAGRVSAPAAASGGASSGGAAAPAASTDNGAAPAAPDASGGATVDTAPAATDAPAPAAGAPAAGQPAAAQPGGMSENCDPATGRIKVPTVYAPSCVAAYSGNNGGETYPGVTGDTITVVVYQGQADPATTAALAAAGVSDQPADVQDTVQKYVDAYNHVFQLWGRKVKIVFKQGSGASSDEQAAKADAIDVATNIKAIVSLGSPNNAYVNEVVARGVMCICTDQLPNKLYEGWHGMVFSALPSYDAGVFLAAEYIEKQLNHKKAVYAGDPTLQTLTRKFGTTAYDDAEGNYKAGYDFLQSEFTKRGIPNEVASYTFDLTQAQQQATTIIAKFKTDNVTTVVLACDPIYPVFFTKQATQQLYQPEWLLVGGALTDTNVFGRTYDPQQWRHAFGISQLGVHADPTLGDAYRLYQWAYPGQTPRAAGTYPVINPGIFTLFSVLEEAGPTLTAQAISDAFYRYPATGGAFTGGLTTLAVGWFHAGDRGLWPFQTYTGVNDVGIVWWDSTSTGPDEINHQGAGMIRYIDDGRRYLPGQIPGGDSHLFDAADPHAIAIYHTLPPQDQFPTYPYTKYYNNG